MAQLSLDSWDHWNFLYPFNYSSVVVVGLWIYLKPLNSLGDILDEAYINFKMQNQKKRQKRFFFYASTLTTTPHDTHSMGYGKTNF